jgi:uncharacterized membrane protein YesL
VIFADVVEFIKFADYLKLLFGCAASILLPMHLETLISFEKASFIEYSFSKTG